MAFAQLTHVLPQSLLLARHPTARQPGSAPRVDTLHRGRRRVTGQVHPFPTKFPLYPEVAPDRLYASLARSRNWTTPVSTLRLAIALRRSWCVFCSPCHVANYPLATVAPRCGVCNGAVSNALPDQPSTPTCPGRFTPRRTVSSRRLRPSGVLDLLPRLVAASPACPIVTGAQGIDTPPLSERTEA